MMKLNMQLFNHLQRSRSKVTESGDVILIVSVEFVGPPYLVNMDNGYAAHFR